MRDASIGLNHESSAETWKQRGLAQLISPVTPEIFFAKYWEKQPLWMGQRTRAYYGNLLSTDDVDRLIATDDRTAGSLDIVQADKTVERSAFLSADGAIDLIRVYQLFDEGATIVLNRVHLRHEPLAVLCRALENELTMPVQANVYLTPPNAQGFKAHYDTHDVFVLQVEGSKLWELRGCAIEHPLPGQAYDSQSYELGQVTEAFELKPGDIAYIPRGWVHQARADDVSLHVTVGVLSYTWTELILEAVSAACLADPAFRAALPAGFAREDHQSMGGQHQFTALWQRLSEKINFDATIDHFAERLVDTRRPSLRGQLGQIRDLRGLELGSIVGARPGQLFTVKVTNERIFIRHNGRDIEFPAHCADPVRFALRERQFAVATLPGILDDKGKLVLVRRLIREGLVVQRS